uniref:T9SS type B sorting domain-containing protein n=1 Tax=Parabacteroides distasonis TaxID=823 RepID=UPI0040251C25
MLKKELRKILLSLSFVFVAAVSCAQYVVTGGSGSPMKATQSSGDSAERLEVYLVYGMDNVTISYTSSSSSSHQWYRYKTKRLEAEKVASTQNGTTSTIRNVEEGYGYFVEEGAVSRYVWIVDYSKYILNISNLHVSDNSDPCSGLVLAGTGTIQPIYYYWPNTGTRRELSRQFDVIYNTLEYNSDKKEYASKQETAVIEGNLFGKSIPAPWCDTEICVKGDYFARHFGKEVTLCIDEYQAAAVDAHIDTLLIEQEAPNMNTTKSGYCAPATVQFSAIANTPTAGTFIIKLEVSDQSTTCSTEDEVQIDISESYLMIPNAFSPGTTPGINDEFRVAYKSLVKFKAWIFNRWGLQMYYWTDPSQGWDGKKGGKYVQPGVYFYVIEAEGSDGIKYKEKGDINILRPKTIQDENENIQE